MNGLVLLALLVVGANRLFDLKLFGDYEKFANLAAFVFMFLVIYFSTGKNAQLQETPESNEAINTAPDKELEPKEVLSPGVFVVAAIVLILPLVILRIVRGSFADLWLFALTEVLVLICLIRSWGSMKREAAELRRRKLLSKQKR